jgi:hypothetical protein
LDRHLVILAIPLKRTSGYAPGIMTVTTADRSEQRLVWTLVAVLTVVLAYALAGAVGATPASVVHWTGVALLVAGICLASVGMVTARDERLRLEDQLTRAHERPVALDALYEEVVLQADAGPAGQEARGTSRGSIRVSIVAVGTLAGRGGLRLQWCGVACLLLGTILTAFW